MVSCRQAPIAAFGVRALNTATEDHPEVCTGGLKVQAVLSSVEIYNKSVAEGEEDDANSTALIPDGYNLVYQGAPIIVEAWCLGENGVEVGYAKKQGSLNVYLREDSVQVTPAIADRPQCLPDVQRGIPPCIESFAIE